MTESDALGHTTTYSYNAADNRASVLEANGFTTAFVYDDLNRLTLIEYLSPDADASFVYDGAGNRVSMTDVVGSTHWIYEDLYRATSISDPFGQTVGNDYDVLGNRTSLTYPGAIGTVSYDPSDNIRISLKSSKEHCDVAEFRNDVGVV